MRGSAKGAGGQLAEVDGVQRRWRSPVALGVGDGFQLVTVTSQQINCAR